MDNHGWPSRLYALDISRGFAALAVVIWHWQFLAYHGLSLGSNFVREQQPLYSILKPFYEQGARAVDYFFLLSGFIFFWLYKDSIQNRVTSAWVFFVQRFSRLYPLHFVTLLIVALLQWIYRSREHTFFVFPANDAYHYFLQLMFASNWGLQRGESFNSPTWSVSVEVLLYFLFFIIMFYRQGHCFFCLVMSILSFFLMIFVDYRIFSGFTSFFLGGLIFYATIFLSKKRRWWKVAIYVTTVTVWLLVPISFYLVDLNGIFYLFGVAGVFGMIGFPNYVLFPLTLCSLALFELDYGPFLKWISWMGDITYSSYLIHFPIDLLIATAMSYGIVKSDIYLSPIWLLFYFLVLIPLSYLIYQKLSCRCKETSDDKCSRTMSPLKHRLCPN